MTDQICFPQEKAGATVRAGQDLTEEQDQAWDSKEIRSVSELADYALSGGFAIS